jgi:outer membrane protein
MLYRADSLFLVSLAHVYGLETQLPPAAALPARAPDPTFWLPTSAVHTGSAMAKWSTKMNSRITMLGLVTAAVATLHGAPAQAQTQTPAGSQDLQIYGGEMFGDRLTEAPLSGSHPLLNDDVTFGGRYTYDFTDQWGAQLSAGYSPTHTGHVAGGDSDLGLTTVDLDVLWNITPGFTWGGHTLVPYTEVGVGYAWASLDHSLRGVIGTTPVVLTDSNGYTAKVGLGGKYFVTSNFFVDFDARYRYLSRLINEDGRGLNGAETTLSVGYQF